MSQIIDFFKKFKPNKKEDKEIKDGETPNTNNVFMFPTGRTGTTSAPQQPKGPVVGQRCRLTIYLQDGSVLTWVANTRDGATLLPNDFWDDFLSWWKHGTTEFYTMSSDDGDSMFFRKDIKRYEVNLMKGNK